MQDNYQGQVNLKIIVMVNGDVQLCEMLFEIDPSATIRELYQFVKEYYNLPGDFEEWVCHSQERGKEFRSLEQQIGSKLAKDTYIISVKGQVQEKKQPLPSTGQNKVEKEKEKPKGGQKKVTKIVTIIVIIRKQNSEDHQIELDLESKLTIRELYVFLSENFGIVEDQSKWTCYSQQRSSYYDDQDQELGGEFAQDTLIINV